MQREPSDFGFDDFLFVVGALSSILLVLIPERRGGPRPPRPKCSCGCGPAIPTGSEAE